MTSYQKLKQRIEQLQNELYTVANDPDTTEAQSILFSYRMKKQMQDIMKEPVNGNNFGFLSLLEKGAKPEVLRVDSKSRKKQLYLCHKCAKSWDDNFCYVKFQHIDTIEHTKEKCEKYTPLPLCVSCTNHSYENLRHYCSSYGMKLNSLFYKCKYYYKKYT